VNAGLYEARHSFVWNYGADMLPLLAPSLGERILDLGCGPGQLTAKIAEAGATVVGIDSSPEMIGQARQNYPQLQFKLADATRFSFEERFDAVFSNAVLHWVEDAESVVRNVASALRPGGRFVAEFGGKRNVQALLRAAKVVLERHGYVYRDPWYFPSIGQYASLLERHDMEVSGAWHFDRMTPLDEGDDAMRDWIGTFGGIVLAPAPKSQWESITREMEEVLRPELLRDGRWYMDYVRIRVKAEFKPAPDLPR
jgi:trans-aconitate methyltransferase